MEASGTGRVSVSDVPDEIWAEVFSHLAAEGQAFAASLTCKRFLAIARVVCKGSAVTKAKVFLTHPGRLTGRFLLWCSDLCDEDDFGVSRILCLAACRQGLTEELKTLLDRCPSAIKGEELVNYAAVGGSIETIEWLRRRGVPLDSCNMACAEAARGGHLDCLRWLREQGCPLNQWSCEGAACGGHLDCLRWLREQGCPWDPNDICRLAAESGNLELLIWARRKGCEFDEHVAPWAARGGHLDLLRWAAENGCEVDDWAAAYAAEAGQLGVLRWLRERKYPWPEERLANMAAAGGHVDVLDWLVSQGCPLTEQTATIAAKRGYLEMLRWLRSWDPPCPLNE